MQRVICATEIERVVGNPFLLSVAITCFAAGEEGFIVTHNRSISMSEGKIQVYTAASRDYAHVVTEVSALSVVAQFSSGLKKSYF